MIERTLRFRGIVMKMCFLIIYLSHTSVSGAASAQTGITINAKSMSYADLFAQVKRQTGKVVWYGPDFDDKRKISVKFSNASVQEVMDYIIKNTDFSWKTQGEAILISTKKDISKSVVTNAKLVENVNNAVISDTTEKMVDISGKVVDEGGSPIPGATVLVKNGKTGTTTGPDGSFKIDGVRTNASLIITSVAFYSQEIFVKGKSSLGIVYLKEYIGILDETVVMAYGTTSKRLSTSNIDGIKSSDIEKQPINNPILALQGRVSGVYITQASGLPNSGVTVRIQGQNSISNGNDPLYVIDGVPYSGQLLPSLSPVLGLSGSQGLSGNPFSFINPSDIESIDVLKDADATAIYGSRAANGAILITTKKGKPGKTKIDINAQNGWGKVTRKLNLLNTKQYLKMRKEAFSNDNVSPSDIDFDINGTWDSLRYTDWQKELIGRSSHYSDIQASLSGGNESTQYLVGTGYHKETTVFPGDFNDQKASIHININSISLNRKFKFQISSSYLYDLNKISSTDLTQAAIQISPNAPSLYRADGKLNWAEDSLSTSTWFNPLANLLNKYNNKTTNLTSNSSISYEIISGLNIKSSFGYTDLNTNEVIIYPLESTIPENRSGTDRSAVYGNGRISSWIIEPQLTYKVAILHGTLDGLLGTTIQRNNSNQQQISGIGYNSDLVLEDAKAATNVSIPLTLNSVYKYNAVFARINYNYQSKYLINLTARRDGSSRFGAQNRFHNFGSIGLAYIFSKENFFSKYLPIISFGKVKLSYGTTGSDQIGDYKYLNQYIAPTGINNPYQNATGLLPNGLPNPNLQWEETRKIQGGLDLGFLKDRIIFTANYYNNRSSNQLVSYILPITSGFNNIPRNFPATVQNSGLELELNSTNFKEKNLTWTTSINITIPRNKLIKFPNFSNSPLSSQLVIGESTTINKVYHFLGVDPTTGIYQFSDVNGKATSNPTYATDANVIINTSPKMYGGIQNTINYKSFELDFLFQFVKQNGTNYRFGYLPGFFSGIAGIGNQPISIANRWGKEGDISNIQRVSASGNYSDQYYNASGTSDAAISDASYIRLKNISISWSVPKKLLKILNFENVRLYLKGQNLITITNYVGLDPENLSTLSLPPLRVFTTGIQFTL